MRKLAAVLLTILAAVGVAQVPPPLPKITLYENLVLQAALEDSIRLDRLTQLSTRYIWIDTRDKDDARIANLILNYLSSNPLITRSEAIQGKDCLLVRVDTRKIHPDPADRDKFVKAWEQFQFAPRFNLLLTRGTLLFSGIKEVPKHKRTEWDWKLVPCEPWIDNRDGVTYTSRWTKTPKEVEATDLVGADLVRVESEHVDKVTLAQLIELTQSQAPVVSYRYFLSRSLSTIKDAGIFAIIYGGLYYDLSIFPLATQKGQTDEDALLEFLGVGSFKGKLNAREIFNKLRSDQRSAIFRSDVTGSARQVEFLKTIASKESQSIAVFTRDIAREDIDIDVHPVMNLIKFKFKAVEAIWEKANGLHGFGLFNGDGKRQDAAPSNIVVDRLVTAPHTTDLQGAISCIRCHEPGLGWQPMKNDVKTITDGKFDLFADINFKDREDGVARLAGLYGGDLEARILPRARDDYSSSILRATGPWKESKVNQTDVARITAKRIARTFKEYNYDLVTARTALLDFGIDVEEKDAPAALRKLLPKSKIVIDGIAREDMRIGALLHGLGVNRSDYDLVYAFIANRFAKK